MTFDVSNEIIKKLEVFTKVAPGPEKDAMWSEIQDLFPAAASELRAVRNQRPSAYVLADMIKEGETQFQANQPKIPKKLSLWKLFFGFKKPFKY